MQIHTLLNYSYSSISHPPFSVLLEVASIYGCEVELMERFQTFKTDCTLQNRRSTEAVAATRTTLTLWPTRARAAAEAVESRGRPGGGGG